MKFSAKHAIGWALIIFGAYELLWAQIPGEGANFIETLSSGSDSIGGAISNEIASGQLWLGGGAAVAGAAVLKWL